MFAKHDFAFHGRPSCPATIRFQNRVTGDQLRLVPPGDPQAAEESPFAVIHPAPTAVQPRQSRKRSPSNLKLQGGDPCAQKAPVRSADGSMAAMLYDIS